MDKEFEVFLKLNKNRIYYQMHRLLIPKHLHEEFYAEGAVALWKGYKKYNPEKGHMGTFLNNKIRFRLIDLIRKRTREEDTIQIVIREGVIQMDNGNRLRHNRLPILNTYGIKLDNKSLWSEVEKRLTIKQMIWMKYFIIENLKMKDIAEKEDVTIDAVKSWGRQARKKLRREDIKKELENFI